MPATPEPILIKISRTTSVVHAAGAIAAIVRSFGAAQIRSVGAAASNQAIKAIITASHYLGEDGLPPLAMRPVFVTVEIAGRRLSALLFTVWPCTDLPAQQPPSVERGAPFEM